MKCLNQRVQWNGHATSSRGSTLRTPCAIQRSRAMKAHQLKSSESSVAIVDSPSCFDELSKGQARKYIMISGKGGVGKTSLAASLAVKLASAGHVTLVVSTDPAHSLSDSLDQDVSGGKPVVVQGTALPLWGMEVDPEEAKEEFRMYSETSSGGSQIQDFMKSMGLGMIADQLADLKLGELLDTPPPGLDEAVAIAKVVQFVQSQDYAKFDRIIFDTAPTGHTLRLLALPDFLDASLSKIIKLRRKLADTTAAVRSLFGAAESQDEAVAKLEMLRERVLMVKRLFRDTQSTEFIIATIPTILAVSESSRLAAALAKDGIPNKRIIVNQIVGPNMGDVYLRTKLRDQERALDIVRGDPALASLTRLEAPLLDLEVRGIPALSYFGRVVWESLFESMNKSKPGERRYFMLGGKGGVGKTSCAASLAALFASSGEPTLVVSTDPAHSLSDSLDQDVGGGAPVQVTSPMDSSFPLWGMQIDTEKARQEIREITADDGGKKLNQILDSLGLGAISDQLKEMQLGELLDTPPPGVDEAVAIAKVVQFLKAPEYQKFTRIIFDTAPTGHTLRLLSLPDFLDASIGKLVRLRQKLSDATQAVKTFFGGTREVDPAVQKLEELKARMAEARDLFHNTATTQFVIVTIPTVMAVAESSRLASALRTEGIPLKTIVVNQVVLPSAGERFLKARRADQQRALERLRVDPELARLQVIEGPLFDLEVRGVPALTYFGSVVWK